jgi:type I restriction enzyme R subunit
MAFYGVLQPFFAGQALDHTRCEELSAETALAIQAILSRHWKIHFWDDSDAQKQAINEIDDYLYDEVRGRRAVEIPLVEMDELIERTLQVARHRSY